MAKRLQVGMICGMCLAGVSGIAAAQSTQANLYGEGGSAAVTEETAISTDAAAQDAAVDTVGDIEPSDTRRLERRREAKRFGLAGFGPAGYGGDAMDDKDDRMSYDVYLGRAWEVSSRAAIKSIAEVTSDFDDNHLADLSLGANFYALPTDFSPYLGADLGLGAGRADGENAFGFTAGASLGALLFRTASTQLNVEGNAEVMLSELEDEFPTVYSATVGVMF